jgi:ribosomal protein S18 acetylase RimI-like enzyme
MFVIERASSHDLATLWALDQLVFGHPEEGEALKEAIDNGECWVAREAGACVGYAIFGTFLHGHGFLRVIAVHPDHRRSGVASALVGHLEGLCPTDRMFTATTGSNLTMQRVAEALGFVKSGEIEGVEDDDVELIYVKRLPGRESAVRLPGRPR